VKVGIPRDLIAELEAIPDKHRGSKHEWTAEKDAALLKYWDLKPQRLVSKALGVSENTARNRVQELREAKNARR
jgi:DNA-binding transcriptional regulator LsrR (DeoR family)